MTTKEKIDELVRQYYEEEKAKEKPYERGDYIHYASRVYDSDELVRLVDSSLEFWLTSGHNSLEFEKKFAEFIGIKKCLLTNSGSSANLLAFMTLTSDLLGERKIKRGDEVITLACGFPTTVTPIINYGAIPVFVDVTIPQYNIDVSQLELALSKKTKAVMIAHTLGNPFDLKAVKEFCDKHHLWLIEDNCDALGAEYEIDGKKYKTGSLGDIGTSSFYPAHHITMGEGGAVYMNDPFLYKICKSFRDWGRDCVCDPGVDNSCHHRYDGKYGELPFGFDHKYVYSEFGYNLKVTDMQAAIGLSQLEKLPSFIEKRRHNWERLYKNLEGCQDKIILPAPCPNSIPSPFGFALSVKGSIDRTKMTKYLEEAGVQTRNVFAGNLLRHPCFDKMREENKGFRVVGDLHVTDQIMDKTFWIGVYPGMTDEMIDYMSDMIKEFLDKYRGFSE